MTDWRPAALRPWEFVWSGGQPCCGASNAPCPRPPGLVVDTLTGCEKCGHPVSCHAFTWSTP